MHKHRFAAYALSFLLMPAVALAAISVTATAPYPGTTVNAGTRVSFSVIATGFSGPTYTVVDSFGGGANSGNIDSAGNFFWNTNISLVGTHTITITATDSLGNTGSVTQIIVVNSGPTLAIQTPASSVVTVGNPVTFTVVPSGLFNPTCSAADSFLGSSMSTGAVGPNGTFNWTPLPQDVGTHTITVITKDSLGYTASSSQTLTVLPIPTLTILDLAPGYTLRAGQTLSFVATTTGFIKPTYAIADSFNDGTSTTATISAAGKVSWAPQPNDVGGHTFIITVSDSNGRSLAAKMSIRVDTGGYAAPAPVAASATTTTSTPPANPAAPTSAYTFTKFMTLGSTGAEVAALQRALIAGGYLNGSATGYFGQLTRRALQSYQSAHGIQPLGYVGPGTRAALNKGN